MSQKGGYAVTDNDKRLIRENAHYVREALFGCVTETQVECSVAFARYLNRAGINAENYWLFLRLIMTNNPWVIDELVHDREPRLLFSTIRPDAELIEAAFQAIYCRHPEELHGKALEALLGIVENAYFDPDDGFRIRRLSMADINALGKFLLKDEAQEHPQNRLILDILDKITRLGEYYNEQDKSVLSKHAFNVRYAYFDRTRALVDAIPEPLLVRVPDRQVAGPEEDYADLVAKRRQRKRDTYGRFVREIEAPASDESLSAAPQPSKPLPETARAPIDRPAPAAEPSKARAKVASDKAPDTGPVAPAARPAATAKKPQRPAPEPKPAAKTKASTS